MEKEMWGAEGRWPGPGRGPQGRYGHHSSHPNTGYGMHPSQAYGMHQRQTYGMYPGQPVYMRRPQTGRVPPHPYDVEINGGQAMWTEEAAREARRAAASNMPPHPNAPHGGAVHGPPHSSPHPQPPLGPGESEYWYHHRGGPMPSSIGPGGGGRGGPGGPGGPGQGPGGGIGDGPNGPEGSVVRSGHSGAPGGTRGTYSSES
ncbi:unnamed protein product, partial [Discosporangium mesarthrocarpum]